jgi:hypothetical protein
VEPRWPTQAARPSIRYGDVDFDPWTAVVSGLSSQQLANDPGGDRYLGLIDAAVAMFSDYVNRRR